MISTHPTSRGELERYQTGRLVSLLHEVIPTNPFWAVRFNAAGVKPAKIQSVDDLWRLPFVTKAEILADQQAHPPYGSNLTYERTRYSRLHQTSGTTGKPMRWLDTPESWGWVLGCWEQLFGLLGLTREDRLFFPFSFGPFLGFWAGFEGANRLGNLCLPGGGLSSLARLNLMLENEATIVCCTPTYALRLAEIAAEQKIDLRGSPVRALLVAGEPGGNVPATRERIEAAWGARVFDHWGMTELGPLAIEAAADPGSLYVLETECIAEIVDPQTGVAVPAGTEGELVITNLGRWGSPLIRYRTGDRVRATISDDATPDPGRSPVFQKSRASDASGAPPPNPPLLTGGKASLPPLARGGGGGSRGAPTGPFLRLDGGILGRTDEMLTIRGNNLYPSALEDVLRRFDSIAEYRIEVRAIKSMQHLRIEIEPTPAASATGTTAQLVQQVADTIKDRWHFHAEVVAVAPGTLPRFELKGRRFFRVE